MGPGDDLNRTHHTDILVLKDVAVAEEPATFGAGSGRDDSPDRITVALPNGEAK